MSRALPVPLLAAALAEYERNELIAVTTRNVSASPIFKDSCAIKPVGVTDLRREFEEVYNPRLHCGSEVTRADIIEHMVEIVPGASFEETLGISPFAFPGWYRVNVWILNAEGSLAAGTPAISGIFRVFPARN